MKAQQPNAAQTLAKVEAYYKTAKTFNLDVEYAMYKGYTGTYLTESYKGSMHKNGDVTQLKVLGSEILQFPKVQLTIIDENKTVVFSPITNKNLQKSPVDISVFLKFYKEVSTQVSGNTIIHELVVKNIQLPVPYNKIILHVNKTDFSIQKQVLYLSTKMPFVDEEGKDTEDVGRMVITFKTNPMSIKTPQLQNYVVLEPNKKPCLAKAYAAYTIIDQSNI
ncbi:hypothetical protein QLS71_007975 [Mariniflexile litorale]|uniref:Uncharacterized protein n=1 Tax=Mariniflexile litorale TaxID=3045158 RepID=A0AAU7EJY9_9FLAO|nr:hypothetical protein [Mariniflexile sp. KMM 9835]MDQ8213270.1 hypothetical protein [Mariniflexile sp. KMM 9835]